MKTIDLKLNCRDRFLIRQSDGYTIYSALLSAIESRDSQTSSHLHDSGYSTFLNTGLSGDFRITDESRESHKKYTLPGNDYDMRLAFLTDKAQDAYSALINYFILDENPLSLTNGDLYISEASTKSVTHEDLFNKAAESDAQRIWFKFLSPVCLSDGDLITTMLPHRSVVFSSLVTRWNLTCPEHLEIALDKEAIRNNLIEIPGDYNLESHTVLTSITNLDDSDNYRADDPTVNESNMTKKLLRQGFTGEFGYQFKQASDSTQNAIRSLALFSELSGLGRATSRGCGATEVTLS